MKLGYRRVSSIDQNPARQLEGLHFDEVFTDYISGKTIKRAELERMLQFARKGDVVYVHSLDRLGRNLWDLKKIVDLLLNKGVAIHFIKENLVFDGNQSPLSTLMFNLLGSFAEFERNLIRERQLEGIKIAKAKGVYQRKPKFSADKIEDMRNLLKMGLSKAKTSKKTGISVSQIYYYLKRNPDFLK